MVFRLITWNGESSRTFLGTSTNIFCSQRHQVRDSQHHNTKLILIVGHHRNPFGYQPWREKRTFQVSSFILQPTSDNLTHPYAGYVRYP